MSSYSQNASFWIDIIRHGRDRFRTELTDEATLSLVGPCEGLQVLDAGCGEGYLSRLLVERGAEVVGVDTAAELVEAARLEAARQGLAAVEHRVADVRDLPTEFTGRFDVAVLNHVVNDLKDPAPAFAQVARALRPEGRAVVLMLHPCFAREEVGVREYFANREVSRCFEVAGTRSPAPVVYWVQPLEAYSSLLVESGFVITRIQEPRPTEEQLTDLWWREHFTFPRFLLIEARRSG